MKSIPRLLPALCLAAALCRPARAEEPQTGTFSVDAPRFKSHVAATVPAETLKHGDVPLVVVLHGAGGTAEGFLHFWSPLAESRGFVVIAPKSNGDAWGAVDRDLIKASVAWARAAYPAISADRILLTGFSSGGNATLLLGLRDPGLYAALAPASGFQIDVLKPGHMQNGKALPLLMVCGEQDGDYFPMLGATKDRLKKEGFDIVVHTDPTAGHEYLRGTPEIVFNWFAGHASQVRIGRDVEAAEALVKSGKPGEGLLLLERVASRRASNAVEADRKPLDEAIAAAKKRAETVFEEWSKAEGGPAFDDLAAARKERAKGNLKPAAKKLKAVAEKFEKTPAATYALAALESILADPDKGPAVADDLAGKEAATLLSRGDASRKAKKNEEARAAYETLVRNFPRTTLAAKARQALGELGAPAADDPSAILKAPWAPSKIPQDLQDSLTSSARASASGDGKAFTTFRAALKAIQEKGFAEEDVNQVLRGCGLYWDGDLGQLFRIE